MASIKAIFALLVVTLLSYSTQGASIAEPNGLGPFGFLGQYISRLEHEIFHNAFRHIRAERAKYNTETCSEAGNTGPCLYEGLERDVINNNATCFVYTMGQCSVQRWLDMGCVQKCRLPPANTEKPSDAPTPVDNPATTRNPITTV